MLPVKNFYGKIGGVSMRDLTQNLDYGLKTYEERKECLEDILYKDGQPIEFFQQVFNQDFDKRIDKDKCVMNPKTGQYMHIMDFIDVYGEEEAIEKGYISSNKNHTGLNNSNIKLVVNGGDNLYSETNIAQGLERMADYLLMAEDVERDKRTEYNFYKEEDFERKIRRSGECSLNGIVEKGTSGGTMEGSEVIDYLIRKGTNYKLSTDQVLHKKDVEKVSELQDYQKALDTLTREQKSTDKVYYKKRLGKIKKFIEEDMKTIKDLKLGTIYFKQVLPDSCKIDYDQFDFMDRQMVEELLKMKPRNDLQEDLACLTQDLEEIIKECQFNKKDLKIIKRLREESSVMDIADELELSRQSVNSLVNRIIKKVVEKYEDIYEDWYYLNVVKGKYKQCSKCGEIKIANNRHFKKNSSSKDGLYSICKECSSCK